MSKVLLWTESEIEELKKLAGTISCSQISKILGRSKDAIKNKIWSMDLPRYEVVAKAVAKEIKPKKVAKPVEVKPKAEPKPKRNPISSNINYKNPDAAIRMKKIETPSRIEYCSTCHSPVSSWEEHTQRMGCRKTA